MDCLLYSPAKTEKYIRLPLDDPYNRWMLIKVIIVFLFQKCSILIIIIILNGMGYLIQKLDSFVNIFNALLWFLIYLIFLFLSLFIYFFANN